MPFLKYINTSKTSNKILYAGLGFSVKTWKLLCNIELRVHSKKIGKNNIKRVIYYSYSEKLEKLGLATL